MRNLATVNSEYYVECGIPSENKWVPFQDDNGKAIMYPSDEDARKSALKAMEQNKLDSYRVVKVVYQTVG